MKRLEFLRSLAAVVVAPLGLVAAEREPAAEFYVAEYRVDDLFGINCTVINRRIHRDEFGRVHSIVPYDPVEDELRYKALQMKRDLEVVLALP